MHRLLAGTSKQDTRGQDALDIMSCLGGYPKPVSPKQRRKKRTTPLPSRLLSLAVAVLREEIHGHRPAQKGPQRPYV